MSTPPIIPIEFRAKVVVIEGRNVTLQPIDDPDAADYFRQAPIFKINASPDTHGGPGDPGDSGGDKAPG